MEEKELSEEEIEKELSETEDTWAWAIGLMEQHLRKCPLYPERCPIISLPDDKEILKP